ncbi:predicted protein [Coccidioides posadasii str. Silveira]|uniref:Predicted protein n=1 Tax=Coccidioides posadasii (strain RMSCC 757 / Silveira) TaxID=443226 RepID=E9DHT1_COCPS|nr:predicted protein [Coccidioides posadasii str. Silveira]
MQRGTYPKKYMHIFKALPMFCLVQTVFICVGIAVLFSPQFEPNISIIAGSIEFIPLSEDSIGDSIRYASRIAAQSINKRGSSPNLI